MDRETAKLYCTSFITWMKGAFDKNTKLMKQVEDLEKAFTSIVVSYENEIAELKHEKKM